MLDQVAFCVFVGRELEYCPSFQSPLPRTFRDLSQHLTRQQRKLYPRISMRTAVRQPASQLT